MSGAVSIAQCLGHCSTSSMYCICMKLGYCFSILSICQFLYSFNTENGIQKKTTAHTPISSLPVFGFPILVLSSCSRFSGAFSGVKHKKDKKKKPPQGRDSSDPGALGGCTDASFGFPVAISFDYYGLSVVLKMGKTKACMAGLPYSCHQSVLDFRTCCHQSVLTRRL